MKQLRTLTLALTALITICASAGAEERLKMSTTTSTQDSGLLTVLLPPFEKQHNVKVDVIAVGTGQALKLGEEARVPLADFSLDGSARAELRQERRRAERAGASFEVIPREGVDALLPQLDEISAAWLAKRASAEKGFSVGSYSHHYLRRFPLALLRCEGFPVAFANLWCSAHHHELSVDLMRFGPDAPRGAMDFLFIELMLWGRTQGFRWFNLGMAPLAGLEKHPLAPVWHRIGNFLFEHGEHFYNFEGLRRYKSKFAPDWRPRYLMAPGGLALPRVLLDVSLLISGGARGLVGKRE